MKELCFDISTWQGGINYQAIKDRTNYCILRAGFSTTRDNQFDNHYWELQGLNLGAYWYSYAQSPDEAREEAYKFLEVVDGKQFTLPLYLDIEDPSMAWLDRGTLDEIVRAFGEVIENAGYYFGVYSNLNWYRNIISGRELNDSYDWWIAAWYDGEDGPDGVDYGVWQFTSDYNDFGWRLDANWVYKDYPTIIREAGLNHLGGEPTPTPTPEPTPTPTPEPSDEFHIGERVVVTGYATEDSYGGGERTADYTGNPNDPDDIRFITAINPGAPRPYHISVGNTLGDGDRGWVAADQIKRL